MFWLIYPLAFFISDLGFHTEYPTEQFIWTLYLKHCDYNNKDKVKYLNINNNNYNNNNSEWNLDLRKKTEYGKSD